MSGSEDEKLSQLIRDYFEIDSTSPTSSSSKPFPVDHHSSLASLQEILQSVTVAEAEILEKIFLYYSRDHLEPSKLRKWIVMKLGTDHYEASLCRTSWLTRTTFNDPSGDYEYIEVMMKRKKNDDDEINADVRLIVDVDFRSQFELARPTTQYEELSNCLPKIFVGSGPKLEKIISLLCPAAKVSLRERGLHIPPWRKVSYMHSKWLSKNCKKISFSELDPV